MTYLTILVQTASLSGYILVCVVRQQRYSGEKKPMYAWCTHQWPHGEDLGICQRHDGLFGAASFCFLSLSVYYCGIECSRCVRVHFETK